MEKEGMVPKRKWMRILLIALGVWIVLGYPIFNLIAYMDASRENPSIHGAMRWSSMILGLAFFIARAVLFCMEAGKKEGKGYQVGTWILQGCFLVLAILGIFVLKWYSKGLYESETIHYFIEYKDVLAFLAISQGMLQRIFHNLHVLINKSRQNLDVAPRGYVLRILIYALILYEACNLEWYWFSKWVRLFLKMVGQ